MAPNGAYDGFTVAGEPLCEGVSITHHRQARFEAGPMARKAWGLLLGFGRGRRRRA